MRDAAVGARLTAAGRRIYRRVRRAAGNVLDRRSGIETSQELHRQELGLTDSDHVGYEPTEWNVIDRSLRAIDVGPDAVLLDVGSGKGRVLVAAAQLPFRRITGIELSPVLNDAARRNLEAVRDRRRAASVEVLETDAQTYEIPTDVTHVYVYNPFRKAMFAKFLSQLLASLDANPRDLTLIYVVPLEHDQVLATGRFELTKRLRRSRIPLLTSPARSVYIYRSLPAERGDVPASDHGSG
jgi:SAM-dependent methyltransferase